VILITAYQSGSARALAPVIRALEQAGEGPITVAAFPLAAQAFAEGKIQSEIVEDIEAVCQHLGPSTRITVTGTSWIPKLEAEIWMRSRKAGIPSLAVLDNWNEIGRRFTWPEDKPAFHSSPDCIAVMDEWTRRDMQNRGCPGDKIAVTGQPALDVCSEPRQIGKEEARKRLGLPSDAYIILFISEAIETFFGKGTPLSKEHPGYDDEVVLEQLLTALENSTIPDVMVIAKPHPSEEAERSGKVLEAFPKIKSKVAGKESGRVLAQAADAVVGTTSLLLLEAFLMKRPVCAHRPGAHRKSEMLEAHSGWIPETKTVPELSQWLQRLPESTRAGAVIKPAAKAVCTLIQKMIRAPLSR